MKVYVVTNGSYSDYSIWAVSLNREKAEKLKKYLKADNDIEEYDTDQFDVFASGKLKIYYVVLNELGNFNKVRVNEDPCIGSLMGKFTNYEFDEKRYFYGNNVIAEDPQHAVKITQDKRAEMLAQKEGL